MMRTSGIGRLLILAAAPAFGQSAADLSTFEVASVKRDVNSDFARMRGGPGTPDPEQITYVGVNLLRLVDIA